MNGRVRWTLGAIGWIAGVVAVTPLAGRFTLEPLVQLVVTNTPGGIVTTGIETLGDAALPLVAAGVGVAVVALAAGAGPVLGRTTASIPHRTAAGVAGLAFATYVLFGTANPNLGLPRRLLAVGIALVPPVALLRYVAWARTEIESRRPFLRRAGVVAVGAVGAGSASLASRWALGPPYPDDADRALAEKNGVGHTIADGTTVSAGDSVDANEFDFGAMPPRVGDVRDHYVVDKNFSNPAVDADSWSLAVDGLVDEPYELTHDELLEHPDAVDQIVTTLCISNSVGGNLISTAEWQAVPLVRLLEAAGVREDAVDVVTHAVDGYSEAIPVAVARREDVLVAFGATDRTLSVDHGFPARLLIPGRYGMKSTKWLNRIEVKDSDHESYWESRGWVEEAVVNTLSYVRAIQVRGDRTTVGGVAYAGRRGIDRVEVSVDDGETWTDAELEAAPSPHAWRRWRHEFATPDADAIEVVVRATDGTGERQTREETPPHPGGSTGWHRRTSYI